MEYLKEIISIVDKNKTKHIDIIGSDKFKETKLYQLYEGILSGNIDSDIQACKELYNNTRMQKGYRNLKSRLEKKVINTLFFMDYDSSTYNEYQRTYYACIKKSAAVKLLLGKGARKTSVKLAEKTLTKVLKFEFYDIAIPLLKDLRMYYGALHGEQKMFNKYNNLLKQITKDAEYEERAEEMYILLYSQFVKAKTVNVNHQKMAEVYSEELKKYLGKAKSRKFHFYAYMVLGLLYEVENKYKDVIDICEEALLFLKKYKHTRNTEIFAITFKKLTSHIQLNEYELAEKDLEVCFELTPEGSINWFLTSQFYILLLFHSERFQEAFQFFNHVKIILKKKKSEAGLDFWNIIEAFINYFIRVGKIELAEGKRRPRFSYDDFMKKGKSSAFAKDKRGMNVTILVLQILFLLREKGGGIKVIDRMEPLTSYTSKYLRNDENFRSNCFIKMIAKISDADFNRIGLERKTKDLYRKLKTKPLDVSSEPLEMEIVPFEMLWEMVLDSL